MRSSIIYLKFRLITRLLAYILYTHILYMCMLSAIWQCAYKKAIKLRTMLGTKMQGMNIDKYRYC